MARHRNFEIQLENFRKEAAIASQYIYCDMAIQHAASKSKKLLDRLNDTPVFWLACKAALQSAGYISLGRIFDKNSKYNVDALLEAMEKSIVIFQKEALASRKRGEGTIDPPWLSEYLDSAYYPTIKDVKKIKAKVDEYRVVYERAIRPVRNKYIAHREKEERAEVKALYSNGTVGDLWRLTTFLCQLHEVIWELLHNGRRPVFRPVRRSVKAIYDATTQRSLPPEKIVADVKILMQFIETATPHSGSKVT
ncbi:MAG: transposase [Pseudomonadota bacterium]